MSSSAMRSGLLFAGMYIAVNLAAIGFYLGERRDEFNPLKHLVIPILGIVLMIPAFLSVLGGLTIPSSTSGAAAHGARTTSSPLLVRVWMVIGRGAVLRGCAPGAQTRSARIGEADRGLRA